jgi:hypothetical protein
MFFRVFCQEPDNLDEYTNKELNQIPGVLLLDCLPHLFPYQGHYDSIMADFPDFAANVLERLRPI